MFNFHNFTSSTSSKIVMLLQPDLLYKLMFEIFVLRLKRQSKTHVVFTLEPAEARPVAGRAETGGGCRMARDGIRGGYGKGGM